MWASRKSPSRAAAGTTGVRDAEPAPFATPPPAARKAIGSITYGRSRELSSSASVSSCRLPRCSSDQRVPVGETSRPLASKIFAGPSAMSETRPVLRSTKPTPPLLSKRARAEPSSFQVQTRRPCRSVTVKYCSRLASSKVTVSDPKPVVRVAPCSWRSHAPAPEVASETDASSVARPKLASVTLSVRPGAGFRTSGADVCGDPSSSMRKRGVEPVACDSGRPAS